MNGIKLLLLPAALLLMSGSAFADLFQDPDMAMDSGSFSYPVSQCCSFFTPTNGGGYLDLYNDTGQTLTQFGLTTFINPGITSIPSTGTIHNGIFTLTPFSCDFGNNPFFEDCSITYDSATGELTTLFYGISTSPGGPQGIPTILPGCSLDPDSPPCQGVGHFAISLNNDFVFQTGVDSGGWSPTASPSLFSSTPTFELADNPEPSAVVLLATVLLAIPVGRRLARRKRS